MNYRTSLHWRLVMVMFILLPSFGCQRGTKNLNSSTFSIALNEGDLEGEPGNGEYGGLALYAFESDHREGAPPDDNGDDPGDTPKPTIYGEEIDKDGCDPNFIVTPPQPCELKQIHVPSFIGKLYYLVFPGSKWDKGSAVGKIIEAQKFYEKYCIYLNFDELTLSPQKAAEFRNRYKTWERDVRNNILPAKHMPKLRNDLKAKNPNATKDEFEELVKKEIERILCNSAIIGKSSIPPRRDLTDEIYDMMKDLQATAIIEHRKNLKNQFKNLENQIKDLKKQKAKANKAQKKAIKKQIKDLLLKKKLKKKARDGAKKIAVVVFVDQYIAFNPAVVRVSATQLKFNQIGITLPDKDSFNVLTHELRHLLGKATPQKGGTRTWWHENCPNAVGAMKKGRPWCEPYQFANEFTIESYFEIIQNGAGVKLLKRIK